MAQYRVIHIIDGDTFVVSPPWTWKGQQGDRVRPVGFDTPEKGTPGGAQAAAKLSHILMGEKVDLTDGVKVHGDRLVCTVLLDDGQNLADYFTKYRT